MSPECATSDWADGVKINVIGRLGLKKLLKCYFFYSINILTGKIDSVSPVKCQLCCKDLFDSPRHVGFTFKFQYNHFGNRLVLLRQVHKHIRNSQVTSLLKVFWRVILISTTKWQSIYIMKLFSISL